MPRTKLADGSPAVEHRGCSENGMSQFFQNAQAMFPLLHLGSVDLRRTWGHLDVFHTSHVSTRGDGKAVLIFDLERLSWNEPSRPGFEHDACTHQVRKVLRILYLPQGGNYLPTSLPTLPTVGRYLPT